MNENRGKGGKKGVTFGSVDEYETREETNGNIIQVITEGPSKAAQLSGPHRMAIKLGCLSVGFGSVIGIVKILTLVASLSVGAMFGIGLVLLVPVMALMIKIGNKWMDHLEGKKATSESRESLQSPKSLGPVSGFGAGHPGDFETHQHRKTASKREISPASKSDEQPHTQKGPGIH